MLKILNGLLLNFELELIFGGYQVQGLSASENEINSAFNVTILEKMASLVVTQRVLKPNESAIIESSLVSTNSQSNCLFFQFPTRPRRRILTQQFHKILFMTLQKTLTLNKRK
jgi:hypothetical protein